ncbi:MAG TPA: LysM peptidoglycan-binding domain-containing protein [bacterium]|nr:LysM peptidoglycan-binding domain-containing protein [bacterium]
MTVAWIKKIETWYLEGCKKIRSIIYREMMNKILGSQKVRRRRRQYSLKHLWNQRNRLLMRRVSGSLKHRLNFPLSLGAFLLAVLLIVPFYSRFSAHPAAKYRDREINSAGIAAGITEVIPVSPKDDGREISATEGSPLGSGITELNRKVDIEHEIVRDETLSEIAYIYGIDLHKIAFYNNISNPNTIRLGDVVRIPSYENEKNISPESVRDYVESSLRQVNKVVSKKTYVSPNLTILSEAHYDGTAVTAHFTIENSSQQQLTNIEWQLGNGRKSFRASTYWTYETPGTYKVTVQAQNAKGQLLRANPIFVDVPHPATYGVDYHQFITLDSINDSFFLDGDLVEVLNYENVDESPIQKKIMPNSTSYRATKPGFYNLKVEKDGALRDYFLFVSPLESRHSDRTNLNWYRTQFNTGTPSNCGPSVAAMVISWGSGQYISVSDIRQQIGWKGNGGTSFTEIIDIINKNNTDARLTRVRQAQDLFDIIDNGTITIAVKDFMKFLDWCGNELRILEFF